MGSPGNVERQKSKTRHEGGQCRDRSNRPEEVLATPSLSDSGDFCKRDRLADPQLCSRGLNKGSPVPWPCCHSATSSPRMPTYNLSQFKIRSARSRNRAAAWRYDLEQWRQYRLAMARTDAERADTEREYEQRSAAGPDFTGYHAKSDFSEPHVHNLDSGGRQAILTAFDQVRAWLWRNARKPHGQAVSRVYREVLSASCWRSP